MHNNRFNPLPDRETSDKIERLDYLHLNYDSACGRVPVSGLLSLAQKKILAD